MLRVEEWFMIRNLARKGLSISEISRRTDKDRKTVRKAIQSQSPPQCRSRQPKGRKIDAFKPYLEKRLAEGVMNAEKLYREILTLGYKGRPRSVRRFVQPYRQPRTQQATIRFETEPGEQAQVDWGCFGFIEHQGRRQRLYCFIMTLGYSRAMYIEFVTSSDEAVFLRCHIHAFRYLGGLPREILHDNQKDGRAQWASYAG
jgi:transposase